MDTRRPMERFSALLFDTLVLRPIILADRFLGERVWDPLDRVTGTLSRTAGKALRSAASTAAGSHPLSAAMDLIDRCEAMVGARGGWEVVDEKTVLRKVPDCPFLPRLSGNPTFCRRLGLTMGREALATAFPGQRIDFEILGTLSGGDPCCTYRLQLREVLRSG